MDLKKKYKYICVCIYLIPTEHIYRIQTLQIKSKWFFKFFSFHYYLALTSI